MERAERLYDGSDNGRGKLCVMASLCQGRIAGLVAGRSGLSSSVCVCACVSVWTRVIGRCYVGSGVYLLRDWRANGVPSVAPSLQPAASAVRNDRQ